MSLPSAAPLDMVMPQGPQMIFAVFNVVPIVIVLLFAYRYWRTKGSPIGFLLMVAGAAAVFNEAVVDVLGKCWFPQHGTWPLYQGWGVVIPSWMLPVYAWYVGAQAFFAYCRYESGITTRGLFRLYAVYAGVNVLLEIPGLNLGLYTYYGNQPFVLLRFPLWWTVCNALMPLLLAGLVFRLDSLLQGVRRLLVIPLGLMAAGMTNAAIAIPVWVSLNSGASLWVTHVAALVSLGLGLLLCYGLSLLVAVDAPVVCSRREAKIGMAGSPMPRV